MFRLLASIPLGLVFAFGLFYFMADLIKPDPNRKKPTSEDQLIEFVRLAPENKVETKTRELPKKAPEPSEAPKMQKMAINQDEDNTKIDASANIPKIDVSPNGDGAIVAGGGTGSLTGSANAGMGMGDKDVMPLVRIEPELPRKAAMAGEGGVATVRFDVTESGTVTNVSVIEEKPRDLDLGRAARQAVLKWKYKPKIVDGKPVAQTGQQTSFIFKIEDEG